jgi:lysophospholipase L1-like esterase
VNNFLLRTISDSSVLLFPLLYVQGQITRRRTPTLEDAAGPTKGIVESNNPPVRLLVFGESTVAGMGIENHDVALAGLTAKSLSQKTSRTVHWQAIGLSGVTAGRAIVELVPQVPKEKFDLIAIAIGVNDTMKFTSPNTWSKQLTTLIGDLRERVGDAPVLFSRLPQMEKFPLFPQPLRGVLGLRSRLLDRTAQNLVPTLSNVHYVSFTMNGNLEELFCEDKFHPSTKAYEQWSASLAEVGAKLIQ